jgi:hypothetical protein
MDTSSHNGRPRAKALRKTLLDPGKKLQRIRHPAIDALAARTVAFAVYLAADDGTLLADGRRRSRTRPHCV